MIKSNYILLILCFAIGLGFSSCIKEGRGENCLSHLVRVIVIADAYIVRNSTPVTYPQSIENSTLYVFDDNGKYVTSVNNGRYIPGRKYEFLLDIDVEKNYQLALWTNLGKDYFPNYSIEQCEKEKYNKELLELRFRYPENKEVSHDIDDLHFAFTNNAYVQRGVENIFKIPLIPYTNKINITVKGLPETSLNYLFAIEDDNSHYTFTHNFVNHSPENRMFTYKRTAKFEKGEVSATLKTLRLANERSPRILFASLDDNDAVLERLFSEDLITMIKESHPKQIDYNTFFDETHVFDIVLQFNSNLEVGVTINGWTVNHQSLVIG